VKFYFFIFSFVKVKANQFGAILSLNSWINPPPKPTCFFGFKFKEKCKQQKHCQKNWDKKFQRKKVTPNE